MDKPEQENEVKEEVKFEVNEDQEDASSDNSTIVYPKEKQDSANEAKDSSNPFQPVLSPILDSAPIVS